MRRCRQESGGGQDMEAKKLKEKEDIFTYAERRWVVPSPDGSRHTGDM